MNPFVESALKSFCRRPDFFGECAIYVRFERETRGTCFDGFNSQTSFGHMVYQIDGEEKISSALMLKILPRKALFIFDYVLIQFFNEISFYMRALPVLLGVGQVQQLLPKFFDSWIRQSANTSDVVLIFENLGPLGFRVASNYSFLDLQHLSLMLQKLGNFHAFSYRAKKGHQPSKFHSLSKWFYDSQDAIEERFPNFFSMRARRGLQRVRQDSRYAHRLANVERIVASAHQFMHRVNTEERKESMSVLCHGDYLRGNVLFRYDENGQPCDMKMIDLAACRVASPILDLSSVLYLNADQSTRNLHWHHLIDSYHGGLRQVLGDDAPSKESIAHEF